jgi:hypothetical protein
MRNGYLGDLSVEERIISQLHTKKWKGYCWTIRVLVTILPAIRFKADDEMKNRRLQKPRPLAHLIHTLTN